MDIPCGNSFNNLWQHKAMSHDYLCKNFTSNNSAASKRCEAQSNCHNQVQRDIYWARQVAVHKSACKMRGTIQVSQPIANTGKASRTSLHARCTPSKTREATRKSKPIIATTAQTHGTRTNRPATTSAHVTTRTREGVVAKVSRPCSVGGEEKRSRNGDPRRFEHAQEEKGDGQAMTEGYAATTCTLCG